MKGSPLRPPGTGCLTRGAKGRVGRLHCRDPVSLLLARGSRGSGGEPAQTSLGRDAELPGHGAAAEETQEDERRVFPHAHGPRPPTAAGVCVQVRWQVFLREPRQLHPHLLAAAAAGATPEHCWGEVHAAHLGAGHGPSVTSVGSQPAWPGLRPRPVPGRGSPTASLPPRPRDHHRDPRLLVAERVFCGTCLSSPEEPPTPHPGRLGTKPFSSIGNWPRTTIYQLIKLEGCRSSR